jgi:hypothetical protein
VRLPIDEEPLAAPPKSWQQTLQELWELLKAYARQETIGPLKNLQRQVGFGLAGSFLVSLGVFFLVLSEMRALQTHWTWSIEHNWLPYLIAIVILILVMYFAYRRMRLPKTEVGPDPGPPLTVTGPITTAADEQAAAAAAAGPNDGRGEGS